MISKIRNELETQIRARYPVIGLECWEEERVEGVLSEIAGKLGKQLMLWSITRGLLPYGGRYQAKQRADSTTKDPPGVLNAILQRPDPAIYVLKDFHPYFRDPAIVRQLRECAQLLKGSHKTLILLSPNLELPDELDKSVSVIEVGLPDRDEMSRLLDQVVQEVNSKTSIKIDLKRQDRDRIVDATLGLSLNEAENVIAKTLVMGGSLRREDIPVILHEKERIIRRSGLLEFYEVQEMFEEVGGLSSLKEWLRKRGKAFTQEARDFGLPAPKGVLLIGVQGCGKSLCAKAIANIWQLPLLRFDIGRVFNSLVGSSEENVRRAINLAESVAPAVLWIDEIEKGFAGVHSSGMTDGGTASRVFGSFITWLQEKTSPVFVIATSNDITHLPPELMRKGRFDEIFFVDLPEFEERRDIFGIHIRKRKRDPDDFDLDKLAKASDGFSGAEIEETIISAMYDVFDSGQELNTEAVTRAILETRPLSVLMKDQIEALRNWARGRTRSAAEHIIEDQGASRFSGLTP